MAALVLDDELARNEGVDVVVLLAELEAVLEGLGEEVFADAVAAEQGIPVGLRLAALEIGVLVVANEVAQLLADRIPVDTGAAGGSRGARTGSGRSAGHESGNS